MVYKGYGLSKKSEVYLGSCGLKNAAYSISSSAVNDNTFGKLVACPPQVVLLPLLDEFVLFSEFSFPSVKLNCCLPC